jgi:hypothetical protein
MRRTAATGMADIGVQPHIIEAVLNHVGGQQGGLLSARSSPLILNQQSKASDREPIEEWSTT